MTKNKVPKYSIIIPARNGIKYLPSCVETIISQKYDDYELIISDDHSTDGSKDYLTTLLIHPNIKIIEPVESLSMTEHWEWALSHATGEWQIFVGQDDGLQPYFFKLADKLTEIAKIRKIRTIMSERAYFFWQGCEADFGDIAVSYYAKNSFCMHNFYYESMKALLGIQSYFELPEMYTTSIFHKSILDEAREKQNGNVLTCHPQDANLGAIACSLDTYYLKSHIPLGWVGTSPKSAGMAISSVNRLENEHDSEIKKLEKEYRDKINNSKIKYHEFAGDFSFGDLSVYFWQAFLKTTVLRSEKANKFLISSLFKTFFLSSIALRLIVSKKLSLKIDQFKEIVNKNKSSYPTIIIISYIFILMYIFYKIIFFLYKIPRKFYRKFIEKNVILRVHWNENPQLTIQQASNLVQKMINESDLV